MVVESVNPKVRVGEVVVINMSGNELASSDVDHLVLYAHIRPFTVTRAFVSFRLLDAFASNVKVALESDDGSTEAELAAYTTISDTAVLPFQTEMYPLVPFGTVSPVVPVGSWLQLRIDNNEDAVCWWDVVVEGFFTH